jgi:FtsH-binding integral membrane protein
MGIMLGFVSAYVSIVAILAGVAIIFFVVFCVAVISIQTKFDLTKKYSIIIINISASLIGTGIAVGIGYTLSNEVNLQIIYGGFGALIVSLYLAIDTISLMSDERKILFKIDEYAYTAIQLFVGLI